MGKPAPELGSLAAQWLAHAMNAAAGLDVHRHVWIIDLETGGAHLAIEVLGGERRKDPILAERDDIAAERHGLLEARRDDLDLLRLQPLNDVVLGGLQTYRGAMLVEHADHQVDMNVELV